MMLLPLIYLHQRKRHSPIQAKTLDPGFRRDDSFEVSNSLNVIPAKAGIQRLSSHTSKFFQSTPTRKTLIASTPHLTESPHKPYAPHHPPVVLDDPHDYPHRHEPSASDPSGRPVSDEAPARG